MKESQIPVTLHVGKDGVTDSLLAELHEQAENREYVKVRLLRAARTGPSPRETAQDMAARANVRFVEVRGFTALFRKQR